MFHKQYVFQCGNVCGRFINVGDLGCRFTSDVEYLRERIILAGYEAECYEVGLFTDGTEISSPCCTPCGGGKNSAVGYRNKIFGYHFGRCSKLHLRFSSRKNEIFSQPKLYFGKNW